MLDYDLHCHSNVSDGLLPPAELVARAAGRGVKIMALTDHDDIGVWQKPPRRLRNTGWNLFSGVGNLGELAQPTLHIVGLHIDPDNTALQAGLHSVREGRGARARMMAESLARAGIGGALEGLINMPPTLKLSAAPILPVFLVEAGHAKDVRSVFKNFLIKGKRALLPHQWQPCPIAVGWIKGSGGIAVIAIPAATRRGRSRWAARPCAR